MVRVREQLGPILTTKELASIVAEVWGGELTLAIRSASKLNVFKVKGFGGRDSLGRRAHPATKTFQVTSDLFFILSSTF